MVENVGPGVHHDAQRLFQSLKVGNQHFHAASGHASADFGDRVGEDARATDVVVVAIDAGDDRKLQPQFLHRFGDPARLFKIDRLRAAFRYGAEAAAPGAQIAQQHEGRGAMVPALADVGTMRRLADGVQLQVARQGLEIVIVLAHGRARLQPFRFGRRTARANLDLDQLRSSSHAT